jgi:DNA-binding transcriptional ArsR family regulator
VIEWYIVDSKVIEHYDRESNMVEVVSPQSKIRELSAAPRRMPIEIDGAVTYELILTIWQLFSIKEGIENLDVGSQWIEEVRSAITPGLDEEIRSLGGPECGIWLSLLGLVVTAPHPHDPDRFLTWLGQINPQRLRRWMLGYIGESVDPSLIEEAADGDREAIQRIVATKIEGEALDRAVTVFDIPAEELRDRMVSALREFRAEVFSRYESDFGGAIGRAAAAQRAMTSRDAAKTVIEQVTNGLDCEIPLGVTRVILIPSVVLRPLSLIDKQRDTLLVLYGMADEFIDSDPESPPSWLVKTYKALSDDRRLRILRRLSEGETSLDELTELLGLSKSTVHHHISVLRGAGLVRVHLKGDHKDNHSYALREEALVNAGTFLDSYLRADREAAANL